MRYCKKIPTTAEVSAEFGFESQGSDSSESGEDKKAGRLKVTPLSPLCSLLTYFR